MSQVIKVMFALLKKLLFTYETVSKSKFINLEVTKTPHSGYYVYNN